MGIENRDTASNQRGQGQRTDLAVIVHRPAQHDFRRVAFRLGSLMLTRVLSWLPRLARSDATKDR